jgi:hypothetical protein
MTHVDDIRERDPIFLAVVSKEQRFSLIPDFIQEVEDQTLQDEKTEDGQSDWYDEQLKRDLRSLPCGNTTAQEDECRNAEPNNREDAFVEKSHLRRQTPPRSLELIPSNPGVHPSSADHTSSLESLRGIVKPR